MKLEIKIEKNVPMPARMEATLQYPFLASLEVGDSMLLPSKKVADRIQSAIYNYSKTFENGKFSSSIRKAEGNDFRVWKTLKRVQHNTVKIPANTSRFAI